MYHLGKIYLEKTNSLENYAKAAAIFQYCAGFAEKYKVGNAENYLEQAYQVEEQFLDSIKIKSNYKQSKQEILLHKQKLEEIRLAAKEKIEETKDWKVEQISKLTKDIEVTYKDLGKFFVNHDNNKEQNAGLVQQLLSECQKQLGPVPKGCEYAIISLGSLAGGRMTPWSDLEFAIIINEDKKEYKEYFRNLTKLLHIKVINFGETPLRSVGIESLNNFRTAQEEDDWFWDDIISNGFSFDGADWHACKLPLGRQGHYKAAKKVKNENGVEETIIVDKPDYELILTSKELAAFQVQNKQGHDWFKSDVYLVQGLRLVSLIDGSQSLLDEYRQELKEAKNSPIIKSRAFEKLTKDINSFSLKLGDEEEGKLFNIKNDIFRIGDRIIDDLANYCEITANEGQAGLTVWEMLDEMLKLEVLTTEGAQHLKEAISIATWLRVATYCHNDGQSESASTYEPAIDHLSEEHKQVLREKTFYIKDTGILHHFYYVMLRIQGLVELELTQNFSDYIHPTEQSENFLKYGGLFDELDSDYIKGMVHARFLEYDQAISYMEIAREYDAKNLTLLNDLLFLYHKTDAIEKLLLLSKNLKAIIENNYKNEAKHVVDKMDSYNYNNLADAYSKEGRYEEAIKHYNYALKIQLETFKNTPNHSDIAINYNNLGIVYRKKGEYKQAIKYYNEALKIQFEIYKYSLNHLEIAMTYINLGNVYNSEGEYEQAIKYSNKALEINLEIYKNKPNHPTVALNYNNLGLVYNTKGEYEKAIKYYNYALKIQLKTFKYCPNHSDIANNYNNLGGVYGDKGEYEQAIKYHTKALEINLKVYKNCLNHPNIASNYNALGLIYIYKKEYEKAIEYCTKALKMRLKIYKCNPNHPDIAISCNNLGAVYSEKKEFETAIKYYNDALKIYLEVYRANTTHPEIAKICNGLGKAYKNKGDLEICIKYYDQALEIMLAVYKNGFNPKTIKIYNNLERAINNKPKESEEAIKYPNGILKFPLENDNYCSNYPEVVSLCNDLGELHKAKANYEEAIKYHKYALKIRIEISKSNLNNSAAIADSYNNLGVVYRLMGKYEEAIKYHKQALKIRLEVHKNNINHPDIAMSYNNLGLIFIYKENYQEAVEYLNNSLMIQLEFYKSNPNNVAIATNYNNLGLAYNYKGHYTQAIKHYNEALKIQIEIYKLIPNHPSMALLYNNLGLAYDCKGQYTQAIKYYNEALKIQIEIYKLIPNHPDMALLYNNLGAAYLHTKKYPESFKYLLKALVIYKEMLDDNHPTTKIITNNLKIIYEQVSYGNYDFNSLIQEALSELPNQLGDSTLLYLITVGVIPVPEGTTSLHLACCFSKAEAVKTLVEKGANVNFKTKANKTALDIMIELLKQGDSKIEDFKNQLQIIEYLLAKGAKVSNGKNPEIIDQLLKGMILFVKIMSPTFYQEMSGNDQEESNNQSTFEATPTNILGDLKDLPNDDIV